ncbi:hypothetical protein [Jidongwangia harbinensis]|uniref:hypothetical protein n=1 Tax=Jidongwangia harbinensis TaxID=2878561 RepID=UPI001CDA4415|nr:hypothetical protein [Jidongwangia harbinensis]MCA2218315.1 hypothetical protein [Jidongwangia harbinensis]
MTFSRSVVAVSLAGMLAAGVGGLALAGPASAAGLASAAGPASAAGRAGVQATAKAAKPVKTAKPVKKVKPAPKPKKTTAPFSLTGTLAGTDVAGSTVTVLVKGGKTSRGTTVTVTVAPTAKINLNDARAALAALPVGAHVAVGGTVTGTVRIATRVNAEAPEAPETPEVPSGTE